VSERALPTAGSFGAWRLAIRPKTLWAALAPVLVGAAIAARTGVFDPLAGALALIGALCIQIATNLHNDLADAAHGTDTVARLGPARVVAAGLLSPRAVRWGSVVSFAVATLCGLILVRQAGWPVIAIGSCSIVAGICYTGGPYPLAYHGLGDLFSFVFFGFVAVVGTVFVTSGQVVPLAWWASLPIGALTTAILVVNNVRDHEGDRVAGKRTLVVIWGRRFGLAEYGVLLAIAAITPIAVWLTHRSSVWGLLPLLLTPWGWYLVQALRSRTGRALNPILAGTAQLLAGYAVLWAIGLSV
jgi:1,4-dihydroxy-2-naphthoate octaprenyltransferase